MSRGSLGSSGLQLVLLCLAVLLSQAASFAYPPPALARHMHRLATGFARRVTRAGAGRLHMATVAPNVGLPSVERAAARVIPVPVLSDNYAYVFVCPETGLAGCVDPVEPDKILRTVKDQGAQLATAFCTHRHADHSAGNEEMARRAGVDVVSTAYEEIPGVTRTMADGDVMSLGSLDIRALHTPCHTRGHVLFLVTSRRDPSRLPVLFTGDTLFVAGCGRFFEGDGKQMASALSKISSLPKDTLLYCGHEYTVSNLRFALHVEPDNPAVQQKLEWAQRQVSGGGYTVPSSLEQELRHNPFMRWGEEAVAARATGPGGARSAEAVVGALRAMKDNFRAS